MPRPTKCRRVCHFPRNNAFLPVQTPADAPPVVLTVDEYAAIRLMDYELLSQAQCSLRMQIARTTVQKIYESARTKLARALTEGLPLKIEGGSYRLCDGQDRACAAQGGCRRTRTRNPNFHSHIQGEIIMKVAVTYENGAIFQHFGHTEQFKVYTIENGAVAHSEVVSSNGSGHGALAGVLQELGVDTLICGGIGGGAQMALAAAGIRLYGGVQGEADAAVAALLSDSLGYDPDVHCDHHGHGHDHACGEHGCGSHGHDHSCGHGCGHHE